MTTRTAAQRVRPTSAGSLWSAQSRRLLCITAWLTGTHVYKSSRCLQTGQPRTQLLNKVIFAAKNVCKCQLTTSNKTVAWLCNNATDCDTIVVWLKSQVILKDCIKKPLGENCVLAMDAYVTNPWRNTWLRILPETTAHGCPLLHSLTLPPPPTNLSSTCTQNRWPWWVSSVISFYWLYRVNSCRSCSAVWLQLVFTVVHTILLSLGFLLWNALSKACFPVCSLHLFTASRCIWPNVMTCTRNKQAAVFLTAHFKDWPRLRLPQLFLRLPTWSCSY